MTDCSRDIVARIEAARASNTPLYITAGDTKSDILGRTCKARDLDISGHRGIVDLDASELVLTARSGTTLADIEQALATEGLILPFEPPLYDGKATLGGTLACNLSGPARPWRGSIRDAVLGVQLINGKAEQLNFGGRVMKNVAGYDVSRLQAGALGTLGVLSEISLKLLPQPEATATLAFELPAGQAIETMNRRALEPRPLSGAFWLDGTLYLRLSGAAAAVEHTSALWGGDQIEQPELLWENLRDMTLDFFDGEQALWRMSHKATAGNYGEPGKQLIDWAGSQRWLRGDFSRDALEATAKDAGGHLTLFRGGDRDGEVRHSLPPAQQRLQKNLKQAFDPDGILNHGRLYNWM